MLYLVDNETDNTTKTNYLAEAGIMSEAYDVLLTKDDISAVQQAKNMVFYKLW